MHLEDASNNIYSQYDKRIKEHLSFINTIASEEVDMSIEMNQQVLEQLQTEILRNQMFQQGKFSLLLSAMIAKKISAVIVAKLAAKASAKLATKGAVKVGTKLATSAGAGLAGIVCGPGVVICAPLLAIGAWFATDAVIVTADEHFNRDDFRMELENMLDTQKYEIKRKLKAAYAQSFELVSHSSQAKIAMTSVQEKRRVKVSE